MLLYIAFGLFVVLFILSVAVLIGVGLCIGMANLMIYFVPALDLATTLVPAAILATIPLIALGGLFKLWVTEGIKRRLPAYEEDEDDDEYDEPEPPTETKHRPIKYRYPR